MPRIARPADGGWAEEPVSVLGNRLHIGIIALLRRTPEKTSAEIARALEIHRPTILTAIERLLEYDMLLADPPRESATRGQWVRYRVNDPLVSEMYVQLGQAMEEV